MPLQQHNTSFKEVPKLPVTLLRPLFTVLTVLCPQSGLPQCILCYLGIADTPEQFRQGKGQIWGSHLKDEGRLFGSSGSILDCHVQYCYAFKKSLWAEEGSYNRWEKTIEQA